MVEERQLLAVGGQQHAGQIALGVMAAVTAAVVEYAAERVVFVVRGGVVEGRDLPRQQGLVFGLEMFVFMLADSNNNNNIISNTTVVIQLKKKKHTVFSLIPSWPSDLLSALNVVLWCIKRVLDSDQRCWNKTLCKINGIFWILKSIARRTEKYKERQKIFFFKKNK